MFCGHESNIPPTTLDVPVTRKVKQQPFATHSGRTNKEIDLQKRITEQSHGKPTLLTLLPPMLWSYSRTDNSDLLDIAQGCLAKALERQFVTLHTWPRLVAHRMFIVAVS